MTQIYFAGALAALLAGCGTQLINRHSVTEATWRLVRAPGAAANVLPASPAPPTAPAPPTPPATSPAPPPTLVP